MDSPSNLVAYVSGRNKQYFSEIGDFVNIGRTNTHV